MTSFHTEVCSTATVWVCLTPSFSLYNRESERNRSRRPVCVVLCDRSRTGRREKEGSGFADADLCVCVCRCESPGTACSSSAFPSLSSCSSSFCCRVSWWHTSNAWPTVRTILMAWDCERGWGGDTKKMVCVCWSFERTAAGGQRGWMHKWKYTVGEKMRPQRSCTGRKANTERASVWTLCTGNEREDEKCKQEEEREYWGKAGGEGRRKRREEKENKLGQQMLGGLELLVLVYLFCIHAAVTAMIGVVQEQVNLMAEWRLSHF